MARTFTEDFETGAPGAAVATTNSGFDAVSAGITFDTVHQVGTQSGHVVVGATATQTIVQRNFTATSTRYFAWYERWNTLPAAAVYLGSASSGATARAQVRLNPDGTMSLRNALTAVYTSTAVMPTASWVRFEWELVNPTRQRLQMFSGHSTTPLLDSGAQTFNTGTFDRVLLGSTTSVASLDFYIDWVAADDTTWVGPAATAPPPSTTVSASPFLMLVNGQWVGLSTTA